MWPEWLHCMTQVRFLSFWEFPLLHVIRSFCFVEFREDNKWTAAFTWDALAIPRVWVITTHWGPRIGSFRHKKFGVLCELSEILWFHPLSLFDTPKDDFVWAERVNHESGPTLSGLLIRLSWTQFIPRSWSISLVSQTHTISFFLLSEAVIFFFKYQLCPTRLPIPRELKPQTSGVMDLSRRLHRKNPRTLAGYGRHQIWYPSPLTLKMTGTFLVRYTRSHKF